jgi:hypothetical protein
MALIPKVEPKPEKKVVSARLDKKRIPCFSGMQPSSLARRTSISLTNPRNASSVETTSSFSDLKGIIKLRLQPLTRPDLQTQLPRTRPLEPQHRATVKHSMASAFNTSLSGCYVCV